MHNFQESKARGKAGETQFFAKYGKKLKLTLGNGYIEDFVMGRDKEMVELKSDSYDANKTDNFFMEKYYDVEKKKLGGPFRALEKDIKHFIYYFPKNELYYIFDTKQLVKRLNVIIKDMKPVRVLNKNWITVGYKVPRAMLDDLNKAKN